MTAPERTTLASRLLPARGLPGALLVTGPGEALLAREAMALAAALLCPGGDADGTCPSCRRTFVNIVSHEHVDLPFHNDREVGVVEHLFPDDLHAALAEFRDELWSTGFDARRLEL